MDFFFVVENFAKVTISPFLEISLSYHFQFPFTSLLTFSKYWESLWSVFEATLSPARSGFPTIYLAVIYSDHDCFRFFQIIFTMSLAAEDSTSISRFIYLISGCLGLACSVSATIFQLSRTSFFGKFFFSASNPQRLCFTSWTCYMYNWSNPMTSCGYVPDWRLLRKSYFIF